MRRLLKPLQALNLLQSKNEVVKMADWVNRETSWKKRETKEKGSFRTHGLFGIIENLHRKIFRSKPATISSRYQTVKMLEDYRREFEVQKSKTIVHISKLQSRLI